jgi:predicted DNA-binding transcriptional regulator YafY
MRYRRWEAPQEVTRTVQPYGIVLKGGLWYLVAARSGSIRTYRISQIARATVLDDGFDRPGGFDLATHWRAYLDDFDLRRYRGEATIRLTARVFDRLPDLLEPAVVRAARASARPVDPGGRIVVRIPTESAEHSIRTLLPLGAEAEVLAPAELRERFADAIDALADLYRTPGPADIG